VVECLDVELLVGSEHAWVTERFKSFHYIVHLAVFMLFMQNMLGKS